MKLIKSTDLFQKIEFCANFTKKTCFSLFSNYTIPQLPKNVNPFCSKYRKFFIYFDDLSKFPVIFFSKVVFLFIFLKE